MKVFFNASIAGKSENLRAYEIIIKAIKEHGCEIYSDHVIKDECNTENFKLKKDYRNYSKTIRKLLTESDVVVTESTFPSIMVGYILHLALQQRKHVLVLYQNNPHRILVGDSSEYLNVKRYNPKQYQKLKTILGKFFDKTKNKSLNIRFNLMIDEMLDKILEKKSKKINISKADYIRKLIENDVNDGNQFLNTY